MAAASFDAMPKRKSKITAKCVRGERHDNFAQKKHCILVNYYLSWISVLKKLRIERGTRKGLSLLHFHCPHYDACFVSIPFKTYRNILN